MEKVYKKLKEKKYETLIFIIYAILSCIIMIFHESWKDEAQAWMISRDLSFFDIFKQLKYEGHPILWYYIISIFSKCNMPYYTIKIVSWFIMIVSAGILLYKSPFKKSIKTGFVFTYGFLYLYPSIARSYCLIVLAIELIAIFYQDRDQRPIRYILSIALLANTHVLMYGLVGVLLVEFYLEEIFKYKKKIFKQKRILISLVVIIILLIVTLLPLIGCIGTNVDTRTIKTKNHIVQSILLLIYCFVMFVSGYNVVIIGFSIMSLSAIMYWGIKYRFKDFLLITISIIWQVFVIVCIYTGISEQKMVTIFFIVLLFWWRNYNNVKISDDKKVLRK